MQRLFLAAYARARTAGLLESRWARSLFVTAYFAYKRHLEDPFADLVATRRDLFAGGDILDIGANVGYSAVLFTQALDAARRVHAFEPEAGNLAC
jgi:hypothetical protein